MQKIQENAGNHDLDETIRQLTKLSTLLGDFSNRLNELNNYVQNNDLQSAKKLLDEIDAAAQKLLG